MTFVYWLYHLVLVIDMLVDVQDSKFARDTSSMALINNDYSAREEYYSKVRMMTTHKTEINRLNAEVSDMKSELGEVKDLLKQLLLK